MKTKFVLTFIFGVIASAFLCFFCMQRKFDGGDINEMKSVYMVDTLKSQLSESSIQHAFALELETRLKKRSHSLKSLKELQLEIDTINLYFKIKNIASVAYFKDGKYQIVFRPYSENIQDDFYLLNNDSLYCLRPLSVHRNVKSFL